MPEGKGVTFTTVYLQDELSGLVAKTKQAAIDLQKGGRGGPISLGWTTEDTYHRLCSGVSSAYRLSWGCDQDMSEALRPEVGRESFGLVVFWGDPSGPHEQSIAWLRKKLSTQLNG